MVGPDPFRGGVVETLSGAGLPSRQWSVASQRATGVMEALSDRADELVDDLVKAIMGAPKLSDSAWVPPPVAQQNACTANVRSVVAAMAAPAVFDPQPAMQTGADRARPRLAVSSVIERDRSAFRRLWQVLAHEAARHREVDARTVHQMTANLHVAEDLFATAMFTGYRDQQRRQALEELSQRPVTTPTRGPWGRSLTIFACPLRARSWSSPPRWAMWAMRPCPKSSPSCAAWTCTRPGGCCSTSRWASPTSPPSTTSTGSSPC